MDCKFCDKELMEKQKLFETESEYVLYSPRKSTKGRCLVIPKRHIKNIREMNEGEASSFFNTVRIVSKKLNEYLKPEGFNYGFNEGQIAGQTLEHLHFHIIPRYKNDGLPEFHLFHGDPKIKKNLLEEEYWSLIEEFKKYFNI